MTPTHRSQKTPKNLNTMQAVVDEGLALYHESPDDGLGKMLDKRVILDINIDNRFNKPVMWECGGSYGAHSRCLMTVDSDLNLKYPTFVSKLADSYNDNQAFVEITIGHHVLFGCKLVSGEVVVIAMEIMELLHDNEQHLNTMSCRIWSIMLFESYKDFVNETYLNFASKNPNSADVYTLTFTDRSSTACIIAEKINDFMANTPRGILHWRERDRLSREDWGGVLSARGITPIFDRAQLRDTYTQIDKISYSHHTHACTFYDDLRKAAAHDRFQTHVRGGLVMDYAYDPKTKLMAITGVVFSGVGGDNNIVHVARLILDPELTISFWMPNKAPWDASSNEVLTNILASIIPEDEADMEVRHTYRQFLFIG